MKKIQLTALALSVIGAAGLSLAVVSCDNHATDAPLQGGKSGGMKGQHVLTESNTHSIGADHVEASFDGTGNFTYDQTTGNLELTNYNEAGGLSTLTDEPANSWTQTVDGAWSDDGNGGLRLASINGADETSSLELTQVDAASGEFEARATFTSSFIQLYTIVIRYCDGRVEYVYNVPFWQAIRFQPPTAVCCNWLRNLGFYVYGTSRCVWRLAWNACCCWRIYILNRWYDDVMSVDFQEGTPGGGGYPYHTFTEIRSTPVNGGLRSGLTVSNEATYNAATLAE